jgi:hypothetical protein
MIAAKVLAALLISAAAAGFPISSVDGAELKAVTMDSWTRYAQETEARIQAELKSSPRFFAHDFIAPRESAMELQNLRQGKIVVKKLETRTASGREIDVPDGIIHHWRGSVLIPGASLNLVLDRLKNPISEEVQQEDVLASRVLGRQVDGYRLYLKLQRSKIVTVVYNTEHEVRYRQQTPDRAWSSSKGVKIVELSDPNSAAEREKPQGMDHGFLWRLNSYWKYGQVPEGVLVECESISLSRGIPLGIEFLVRPLIDSVARESMERTLESMRRRIISAGKKTGTSITSDIKPAVLGMTFAIASPR